MSMLNRRILHRQTFQRFIAGQPESVCNSYLALFEFHLARLNAKGVAARRLWLLASDVKRRLNYLSRNDIKKMIKGLRVEQFIEAA